MRDLAIVGNYTGVHESPVFGTGKEIWAFGGRGWTLPRMDVEFQLHLPYAWEEVPFVYESMKNAAVPIYTRTAEPQFPTSIAFPFEEVFELTKNIKLQGAPLRYFTSSPAYALALAILQGRSHIELHGIELVEHEYTKQKDCIAFWLGYAAGRGIEVDLHCMEGIFKRPLYGAQREP